MTTPWQGMTPEADARELSAQEFAALRDPAEAFACGRFVMPRLIKTERLQLTPFSLHQFDVFARLFGDPQTTRYIGGPTDRAGALERMARFSGHWRIYGFGLYALSDVEGFLIGYAGLWFPHERPEIEVGYALLPQARGKGYALEAVRAIAELVRAAGAPSLVSYIEPQNQSSQRVAASAGATLSERIVSNGKILEVWRYRVGDGTAVASAPEGVADALDGEDGPILEASVMPLTIRTERLTLCQWRPDHFPRFRDHMADPELMRFIGGADTVFRATRIFAAAAGYWHLQGYGMYAVEHEGRFVGSVGLYHPLNWPQVEIAYNITADARRRGFAAEAVRAVRAVAAEQGHTSLVSYVDPENAASIAVARRVGATHEGDAKFTATVDMVWRHPAPEADPAQAPTIAELTPA